jgi:DNA-binding GntR family transcriptional regulator
LQAESVGVTQVQSVSLTLRSAEDQVYENLRNQIVHGLAPMSPLRLDRIAAALGVSTMPVRVALHRLEAEGLVSTMPRRGSRVAPLKVEDIEEIQRMRCAIEGLAAETGAPRVGPDGLAEMHSRLELLKEAIKNRDIDGYVEHLRAFQIVCYSACKWPRLLRQIDDLRRSAERYLRIAVAGGWDAVGTAQFWDRFYDAVAQHDGAAAKSAVTEALDWTLDFIYGYLENPAPKSGPETVSEGTGN